jgi:hypothetical protein
LLPVCTATLADERQSGHSTANSAAAVINAKMIQSVMTYPANPGPHASRAVHQKV